MQRPGRPEVSRAGSHVQRDVSRHPGCGIAGARPAQGPPAALRHRDAQATDPGIEDERLTTGGHHRRIPGAIIHPLLEPISIIGTCATEAMWDAVLGGELAVICRYCKSSRRRNALRSPRPSGLRPGRASALLPGLTLST